MDIFEEEEKRKEPNLVVNIVIFGVLGVIFGLVLYLIGVYNDINVIIITFFIGALSGFLFYAISLLPEDTRNIVYLIFFLGIFFILGVFVWQHEPINDFISVLGGSIKGAFSWLTCFSNPEKCAGIETTQGENKIATQEFSIDLSYKQDYIEKDGSFNLFVGLNVVNSKAKLDVYPSCKGYYSEKDFDISDLQGYSKGSYFSFPKSSKQIQAGFWCRGSVEGTKEKVIIKLNIPTKTKTDWFITVGREGKGGQEIKHEGIFPITPEIFANMPLGNGEYDLFLKLKPTSGFKLDRLISLETQATPGTEVVCDINKENIKEYWDENENAYVFNCKLYISEAPQKQEQRVISFIVNYLMYKEFEKEIRKKE